MLYPMRLVVPVLALIAGNGCAALAKKTPTPAAEISPRQAAAISAPPGERYFILVFGSQSTPKRAKYTHTWATVVKVTGCESDAPVIEPHTISWMPATLDIHPRSRSVEPGTNLELNFTIEEMLRNDERVSVWGPYEIGPGLYNRFLVQKGFMESGQVGYQCIDSVGEAARNGNGCDCIHAISDMDPLFSRGAYALIYFGDAGSQRIVHELHRRPIIIHPEADHTWLMTQLGICKYPIVQRRYIGRTVPNTPENLERYLRRHE